MAEESLRKSTFSSGLAVLLSSDESRGKNPQKSHLISYHDDLTHQSVERTIEHILDLSHKSIPSPSHPINSTFIRSILNSQFKRFNLDLDSCTGDGISNSRDKVLIDKSSICGSFKTVRDPLLIESDSAFSSARANTCVWKGKYMYEVLLETSGIQQLGWATLSCPFTDHKGAGDADDSYAFDGRRVTKWNREPKSYGQQWAIGDVIGCCIDLDRGEISFYRNGSSLGVAFEKVRRFGQGNGYYPAVSLSDGERCYLNFGSHPFVYPVNGFHPIQAQPGSSRFAGYLLQCLTRLLEAESLEKSDTAYFHKLRRVKRFASLREIFNPISDAILTEFFGLLESDMEYIAWGPLVSFLIEIFRPQEPHDRTALDRIMDLFLQYKGYIALLEQVIVALSVRCKLAPLVLMDCPYTGSYPYLALTCHILGRADVMSLWWKSPDFGFCFEGFLSMKAPNKQDLQILIPSVWWPGSCDDFASESSMVLTMSALSEAIFKIEEMHRKLCSLVMQFSPPGPTRQSPGSIFRVFTQNLILKSRGADRSLTASVSPPASSPLLSLYTVLLHFLSEGFPFQFPFSFPFSPDEPLSGFLHRGGNRRFPLSLFLRTDLYFNNIPRIGGSITHLLKSYRTKNNSTDFKELEWEEGCKDSGEARITHSTTRKPCCCYFVSASSDADVAQTSKESMRYGGTTSSSKGSCKNIPESSSGTCSNGMSGDIEEEKPSSTDRSEDELLAYRPVPGSIPVPVSVSDQSVSNSVALREEELLDLMLLLYHSGVASSFRQAFYYMSQQSQSISLLDDTDKQIKEKSCIQQVKRLKEVRNVYHEELVDCVRHCSWYRILLFARWKLRGMYAACMWIVDLLLVLSDSDSVFTFVPEFYIESLVDCFHALRRSDPPFVSPSVFLKQGLSSFVTFAVKHFNDERIQSADIKDLLLQSISVLVQYRDFLIVFENNREALERMPRGLLSAFDNRAWVPVTNILSRLCKGSGFASSKNSESSSSVLFQVLLRETCVHDEQLFSSFLNRLFNTLSWTMTEFSMSIREMQDKHQIADLQQRKCSVIFDISCNLARVLEFCVREIPEAFLVGPDMNLRRLTELVVFILNHIVSAADADFFDLSLRRPGLQQEKMNRMMILAPLVGIVLNLMDSTGSGSGRTGSNGSDSGRTGLNDVIAVFCSMDCPATIHFGFQCLLDYNWSNVLRGDTLLAKLAQLEEFSSYFRMIAESAKERAGAGQVAASEDDTDDVCCICYNGGSDALFEPCRHRSCFSCITRHLLNSHRCFFCNATVTAVTRV